MAIETKVEFKAFRVPSQQLVNGQPRSHCKYRQAPIRLLGIHHSLVVRDAGTIGVSATFDD